MIAELAPLDVLRRFRDHDGTIADFLDSRLARDPGREALVFEGRAWSWRELVEAAARLAGAFRNHGVTFGDRVAIVSPNSVWHVLTFLAAARLGAIFVPANPQFTEGELAYVLSNCAPRLVLGPPAEVEALKRAAGATQTSVLAFDDALLDGAAVAANAAATSDPCLIIYTSGTTGFPKGAMHSHASFIAAGEAFVERMHLQESDRLLLVLPMFHINAMFYSVAGAFAAGAALLIEERFSASQFWNRVVDLRATQANLIEAAISILLTRPETEFRPEHGLAKIYGVRQAMVERFRARFGVAQLVGGYGMTEIPGVISTPYGETAPPGGMGQLCRHPDPARPWAECRIVDDAGHDLPDGGTGELWVKTPVMMLGYFNDAAQTAETMQDGWFKTGDLVRRDAEGNFFFVARKKDIIRRRGENISGAEIDRIVLSHPDVELAAAIGVPSDMGDEDILVAVKARQGATLREADIVAHCRAQMAAMKVPRYVVIVDALPLTPTHKVAKRLLKDDGRLRAAAKDFG